MREVTGIGLDIIALPSISPNFGETTQFWPLAPDISSMTPFS